MGEEEPKYREIRVAEVERYMKGHRIADPKCPMCADQRWLVGLSSGHPALALCVMDGEGAVRLGEFSPVLPLYCANCAYVWLVSYDAIMDWLSKKNQPDTEETISGGGEANG